jgi:hypothetical protein
MQLQALSAGPASGTFPCYDLLPRADPAANHARSVANRLS